MTNSKAIVLYGRRPVEEYLRLQPTLVKVLYLAPDKDERKYSSVIRLAEAAQVAIRRAMPEGSIRQVNHQGYFAELHDLPYGNLDEVLGNWAEDGLLLALDGVTDPQNLGACIRVANGAGAAAVLLPESRSAGLTAAAVRASAGASAGTPVIRVRNLVRTLEDVKDSHRAWVLGFAGGASESLYDYESQGREILVIGAEERGMRPLVAATCDVTLHLPMQGSIESLNAATAAAVGLYELRRRRL